jgi:prophage lp2 protein 6
MDLKDLIKQLAEKINQQKENILIEEATKNAFIMQG